MDRGRGRKMVDTLSQMAREIIKDIEKEDAFCEAKKKGGFFKTCKAKNILEDSV